MKAPEYRAINPMDQVPAIQHGDAVVPESAAICASLADAFPETGLAPPPNDHLRGPYYRWLFFAAGPMEMAVTNNFMEVVVPEERERMVGYGRLDTVLDVLEAAVSRGDYLVGNSFTAADVYVGSHIAFGMEFGTLEKRPAFERYWERIHNRPAAVRAREIDDALIPPPPPAGAQA